MKFDPVWHRTYNQYGTGIHSIHIYCVWAWMNKKQTLAFPGKKDHSGVFLTPSFLKYVRLHTSRTDLSSEIERHISIYYSTQEHSQLSSHFCHPFCLKETLKYVIYSRRHSSFCLKSSGSVLRKQWTDLSIHFL